MEELKPRFDDVSLNKQCYSLSGKPVIRRHNAQLLIAIYIMHRMLNTTSIMGYTTLAPIPTLDAHSPHNV